MIERRRYPRFALKINAKYRMMDSEQVLRFVNVKNISAEGMCFESDKKLKPGTHVGLEVDLGDRGKPVSLTGEILWVMDIKGLRGGEKKFMNGIKLVDISSSDEGRFLKYYCGRMVEKLSGYLKM
ncbi:MAG: PilZ domain-containing protein [Candidatus Gorgyraea atricola]|nr:PilZ domain-containing protein [Candidatus Gorgyraea atricola]